MLYRILRMLMLGGLLFLSSMAYSGTYHVASQDLNASDSNPGTKDLPFLTIEKGLSVIAGGDSLLVKTGIYPQMGQLLISGVHGGSEENRIVIKNFGEDKPLINDKREGRSGAAVRIEDSEFLTFSGFEIANGMRNGIDIGVYDGEGIDGYDEKVHHIIIENCVVHDYAKFGIYVGGEKNIVRNNVVYGDEAGHDENGIVGIWIDGKENLIKENHVYNSWAEVKNGDGIGLHGEGYNVVRNNHLHDFTDDCIDGWHSGGYNIVEYNECYRAGYDKDGNIHPDDEANGMGIKTNGMQENSAHHWIIRYNRVYNNKTGGISNEDANEGNIFYNNTTYNNGVRGGYVALRDGIMANNVSCDNSSELDPINGNINGAVEDANSWFVNAESRDFHLKDGSPLIDQGIAEIDGGWITISIEDYMGSAPDVGAYEYEGATTSVLDVDGFISADLINAEYQRILSNVQIRVQEHTIEIKTAPHSSGLNDTNPVQILVYDVIGKLTLSKSSSMEQLQTGITLNRPHEAIKNSIYLFVLERGKYRISKRVFL